MQETVADRGTMQHMMWGFQPEYDCDGVRVFGNFCGAAWFQAATAALEDPNAFVVAVILGSDATSIKSRESAHQIYLTLGNLSRSFRQSKYGWQLAGFHPPLINELMKHPEGTSKRRKEWDIQRRRRKLFNATLYQLLRTIIAVYREGGRVVACADGNMRKIVPVLAMWVTDRQEHEHINQVPAHGCFHCIEGDDGTRRVRTANDTKEQVLEAIRTGNTPAHDDCNLPLLEMDTHTGQLEVVSVDRYTSASRELGVYIDFNLLWEVPGVDINCICRCRCPPENALSVIIVMEF